MTQTAKKVAYRAFGYNIHSEIQLPGLHQIEDNEDLADIIIEKGDLTQVWNRLAGPEDFFVVKENLLLFQIHDCAVFSIREGKRIVFSPVEGSDEDEIPLYILGTCMGAVLMQRKIVPLHGSAIAINGKAYAFVGNSGAGKSTLASAFIRKGYDLLSDDVIAVTFSKDQIPYVTPSYPQQKLWQESLNEFQMESGQYRPLFGRQTKYYVPVSSNFSTTILPLGGVFELVKTKREGIGVHPIKGLERLHTLFLHTYRNLFIEPLGLMEWHFKNCTHISNQLSLYKLQRPASFFTAQELVSVILTTINKECE